jgi:hypothetical protein
MILQTTIEHEKRLIKFLFDDEIFISGKQFDNPHIGNVLTISELFEAIDQYIDRMNTEVI